jgi:hypothetical protein
MNRKENTATGSEQTIVFEEWESWVRGRIQAWVQDLLDIPTKWASQNLGSGITVAS